MWKKHLFFINIDSDGNNVEGNNVEENLSFDSCVRESYISAVDKYLEAHPNDADIIGRIRKNPIDESRLAVLKKRVRTASFNILYRLE